MTTTTGSLSPDSNVTLQEDVEESATYTDGYISAIEYATFLIIGASYLWPWNCLLAASAYFRSRLDGHDKLADNFSSFVMSISTVTSTVLLIWLAHRQSNYANRLFVGEHIIAVVFLVLAVTCAFNIPPVIYFVLVQALVFASSIGTSLSQNGSLAIAAELGPEHVQATMVGQAVAGTVPPCVSFLSALAGSKLKPSPTATALYFLLSSTIAFAAYHGFKLVVPEYGHGQYQAVKDGPIDEGSEDRAESSRVSRSSKKEHHVPLEILVQKLAMPAFSIAFTFGIAMAFPVFANIIQSSNGINDTFFVPIVFFVWNWGDLMGRLACAYEKMVVTSASIMVIYAFLRASVIPLLFMCNIQGIGIIRNDLLYLILQFVFGLTNGHLASSIMMSAGLYVGPDEREAAGGFMTSALSIGLAIGSLCSFALVNVVED